MLLALTQAEESVQTLSTGEEILWLFVGVLFSVVIPIAAKTLNPPDGELSAMSTGQRWQPLAAYYGKIGLAAFLVAAFTAFVADYSTMPLAVLAGYAWDSTIQKITNP